MNRLALAFLIALLTSFGAHADVIKTVQAGATDQSVTLRIIDSTDGTPETGVVFNTAGIDLEYWRHGANAAVDITEATQTINGAHTDGGFVHVGHGVYRLDLPDATVASGVTAVDVYGTVTGMIVLGGTVQLSTDTPQTGDSFARLGAPVGASISADLQVIDTNVDDIETDTATTGVLVSSGTGSGQISIASGVVAANATQLSGDATAADNAEAFFDGTGYAGTNNVIPTVTNVTNTVSANAVQISGDSAAADGLEARLDGTCAEYRELGVARGGCTAQSATGTTLVLDAAASFADDVPIGMTLVACGSTQGYCQSRAVTDYVLSTDTATVETWTVTPSGTITYYLFGTSPSSGGGGLDAAGVRSAVGLASANLDTQLGGIQSDTDNVQTRLPASLVSGRMDTSVGAMATDVLTAAAINADAITAAKVAADVGTEIGTATWATTTRLLTAGTNIVLAKGTGVTGFNDLSAAQVNAEADTALADYDPPTRAELTSDINGLLTSQRILTGTCDSGSTTTCVDDALVHPAASQLEGRLICFDDSWCALITTFAPGTDTVTTTKVAPSTRASAAYTIFPATLQ